MSEHHRLTANQARDISAAQKESFEKTLRIIRTMIDGRIKDAAKMGRSYVTISVPQNVFGRESYNIYSMGKALAKELFEDNYEVRGKYTKFTVLWKGATDGDVQDLEPRRDVSKKSVVSVPRPKFR